MSGDREFDQPWRGIIRGLWSLKLADNLGDVRDAEQIWLYPAVRELLNDAPAEVRSEFENIVQSSAEE